jgi:hypothetical protein
MTTIAESICLKIHARAGLGLAKYGVSLDDAPLTRLQALRHAQEEMIDAAEYLEKEIQAEEKRLEEQTKGTNEIADRNKEDSRQNPNAVA